MWHADISLHADYPGYAYMRSHRSVEPERRRRHDVVFAARARCLVVLVQELRELGKGRLCVGQQALRKKGAIHDARVRRGVAKAQTAFVSTCTCIREMLGAKGMRDTVRDQATHLEFCFTDAAVRRGLRAIIVAARARVGSTRPPPCATRAAPPRCLSRNMPLP